MEGRVKNVRIANPDQRGMYGLELANVEVEKVPIMVGPVAKVRIKREKEDFERQKESAD